MRYYQLVDPPCNLEIMMAEAIVEFPSGEINESQEFEDQLDAVYARYDDIKITNPAIGDQFWTLEVFGMAGTDFVSIAKSPELMTYIADSHNSKFPNVQGLLLESSSGRMNFPLLVSCHHLPMAVVDTFLFSKQEERDQLITELHLCLPQGTRIKLQDIRLL